MKIRVNYGWSWPRYELTGKRLNDVRKVQYLSNQQRVCTNRLHFPTVAVKSTKTRTLRVSHCFELSILTPWNHSYSANNYTIHVGP